MQDLQPLVRHQRLGLVGNPEPAADHAYWIPSVVKWCGRTGASVPTWTMLVRGGVVYKLELTTDPREIRVGLPT